MGTNENVFHDAGLADEIVDIDEMGEAILQNLYK